MNALAQTIYSVHLEGLSQAERSAFSGLVRLAERSGMLFRVETAMAQSDIVILDGTDHRIVELGQADNNIAPRAIWIDPPSNLHTPRQLQRPLNWTALLEMMQQVVGVSHKPVFSSEANAPAHPPSRMALDQLCGLSEEVLRRHIGIAAQFLVEDVRDEIKASSGADAAQVDFNTFMVALKRQLPSSLDASKVLHEIADAAGKHGSG